MGWRKGWYRALPVDRLRIGIASHGVAASPGPPADRHRPRLISQSTNAACRMCRVDTTAFPAPMPATTHQLPRRAGPGRPRPLIQQLKLSLPTVGARHRAVQRIPRIPPQVACLRRPGHRTDEQLALGDTGLDGADSRESIAAQRAQQCHACRVRSGDAELRGLRRAQFQLASSATRERRPRQRRCLLRNLGATRHRAPT